jgi:hypothetical protein
MATRIVRIQCRIVVAALVLTGIAPSARRPAHAQSAAASGEGAKGSARTIEEVRGLVAELEVHAERQRSQLQMTEASLRRARALLDELEGGQGNRQQSQHPANTNHSLQEQLSLPEQATAEKKEWSWSEDRTTPQASARQLRDGYTVQIDPTKGKPWALTITVTREGHTIYSWEGHEYSVFVPARDVLYYADFKPGTTGCAVIAYDLKGGKLLWKTRLWGVPVSSHSQYRNRINLEIDDRHLTVYGNESFGRYIELLDLRSGKTVGHRVVGGPNGVR